MLQLRALEFWAWPKFQSYRLRADPGEWPGWKQQVHSSYSSTGDFQFCQNLCPQPALTLQWFYQLQWRNWLKKKILHPERHLNHLWGGRKQKLTKIPIFYISTNGELKIGPFPTLSAAPKGFCVGSWAAKIPPPLSFRTGSMISLSHFQEIQLDETHSLLAVIYFSLFLKRRKVHTCLRDSPRGEHQSHTPLSWSTAEVWLTGCSTLIPKALIITGPQMSQIFKYPEGIRPVEHQEGRKTAGKSSALTLRVPCSD